MSQRSDSILREMGLAPLWKRRGCESVQETAPAARIEMALPTPAPPRQEAAPPRPVASHSVPPWEPMPPEPVLHDAAPGDYAPSDFAPRDSASRMAAQQFFQPAPAVAPVLPQLAGLDWDALQTVVRECQACGLCKQRRQAVFGVGDRQADWLFVGEGPGEEEDDLGEPFVGPSGKLLDAMLAAIHLARGDKVYIANAVKCRPPGNRTPEVEETATCFPFLQRQIALLRPKLIVALGRPAAQTLLGREVKIADVRGKLLSHQGIPLIVTYHPAYLLRNLPDKANAWEDLCFARRTMAGLAR